MVMNIVGVLSFHITGRVGGTCMLMEAKESGLLSRAGRLRCLFC